MVDLDKCFFTEEHEWLFLEEGNKVRVGISDYAQSELGDVVFVDAVEVGTELSAGDSVASLESVKAVSDVYVPVDGTVIEVNEALVDSPQLINEEPESGGWIAVIEIKDKASLESLMKKEQYDSFVDEVR